MTNKRLRKKKVQVKEEESPVLDMSKEVRSNGASIRGFRDLLSLKVDLLI